ncbi:hypothetical protein C8F04DRAFT_1191602 [Mycena alexandri]|uniref:Uncharacterized protein n=1 Tax=Mycena alexandri TaxID=1745969 RepID=A0AAD6SE13_9AGAR|nr:hypothetical protein C8F04DRAFT_1191602 [Mycena alexandri]
MATSSRDPGEFHLQCKALLRDDGAFAAWFAAHGSACDKCSRAGKACAKALAQPGCTGCITVKVRCSLQETYLFEKTKHEFDGKRHEFDALRSAKKSRRRTAEEPRRRTAARGLSSIPVAHGATAAPNSTMPPPPMFPYPPMQLSNGPLDPSFTPSVSAMLHPHEFSPYGLSGPSFNASGVRDPARFIDQHIDPALLPPVEDSVDTNRFDFVDMRAPSISHMIHQSVQTDNVQDSVDDPVPPLAGTVALPDVPLETLDIEELCNFVRSLSARVAYLEGLHHSARPLSSLSREEIPAEMVAQCISAILNGHFEMLVAFSATKHRLRANTSVAPDVLQHIENLSKECHSLSKMLAQLDEGRRSAPDVFASTISRTPDEGTPHDTKLAANFMLARMNSYGPATVALADYDKDFVAVRQASMDDGSVFAFKRMPERDQTTDYGTKESLHNYVGSVFGEVTDVYTLSDGLCVLRIKMPSNASCALHALWESQWRVLMSLLAKDDPDLGGVVKSSYFDYSAVYPALRPISGTFFVRMLWSHGMRRRLTASKYVIARVTFVRFHGNEVGGGNLERYYHMEVRGLEARRVGYFPARGPLYRCDGSNPTGYKIRDHPTLSLALAKYQRHFVAVRDHSDGCECVFAFKNSIDVLINPSSERRWPQPSHYALAYGEIKRVYRLSEVGGYCIVLTCPKNATCDAVTWRDRDVMVRPNSRKSKDAAKDRVVLFVHPTLLPISAQVTLRSANEGQAGEYEKIFVTENPVGKMLECTLEFKRRHIETGTTVLKYAAPTRLRVYPVQGRKLQLAGRMALATVEYGNDFTAVRESSYFGGSEFFFAEDNNLSTLSEIQGGLGLRINIIVGEIEKISGVTACSLGPACDVLCVKIRPPSNSSCEAYNVYFKQLKQLHRILEMDSENGWTQPVGSSWFDASRDFDGWGPQKYCFYVYVRNTRDDRTERIMSLTPGTCVAFCGTMSRLDEDAEKTRNYYIWALEFLPGEFPTGGKDRACGLSACPVCH